MLSLTLNFFQVFHRRGKRCKLFSFSSKWLGNFKQDFIDKRLVNSVKYHYLSLRLLRSLFKKFENKCKNKHEVQIKLSKVQTCTTDLASYSLTQWQFWQLTLKWLSGARAQDKNKQYYCCFLFFSFLFNYAIQGKFLTWIPRQVMNFPIITFSPFCIISRKLKINIKHLIKHCYYTAIYIIVVMDTPIAYCHDLLFSLNYF